jgi:hypothetical protein
MTTHGGVRRGLCANHHKSTATSNRTRPQMGITALLTNACLLRPFRRSLRRRLWTGLVDLILRLLAISTSIQKILACHIASSLTEGTMRSRVNHPQQLTYLHHLQQLTYLHHHTQRTHLNHTQRTHINHTQRTHINHTQRTHINHTQRTHLNHTQRLGHQ